MGEVNAFPEGLFTLEPLPPRRTGFRERAGPAEPLAPPKPAGTTTSSRFPLTSTTTRSRSIDSGTEGGGPEYGGISAAHSVSIQRVCTRNSPLAAVKAGSSSTARWKGVTVGMPSTTSSLSARRARAMACERSAPLTMILATSESKLPGTVMPLRYPSSTRTPGPAGDRRVVVTEGLTIRDPEHLPHQIQPGHLLRHRMLDL